MRISLVVPDFLSGTSFLQQPLDFLYTATILEKNGHYVSIFDCRTSHISKKDLIKKLSESELIIITTTPCDQVQNYYVDYRYAYSISLINYIKKHLLDIPVVVCGAHGTVRCDLLEKDIISDAIVLGEIPYTALELANCIESSVGFASVPNIAFHKDNEWIHNEIETKLYHPCIDDTILPAFDKVPMQSYFGVEYINNIPLRRQNRAVLQSGRGCPYSCNFCHNFYGKHIYRRSVEAVVNEMEICQQEYGVREIFFLDELFTIDANWIHNFAIEINNRKIHLALTIQTRVDCITTDVLEDLRMAGVKDIWLGIESADNSILGLSNKGEVNEILVPIINLIKRYNINPNAFFMIGMPGETIDTLNKTIKTIYTEKIPYTRSIMICTPRYGTKLYELAVQQYPFIQNSFFSLNSVKGLVANEMTPHILQTAKDILKNRNFLFEPICPQIEKG